MKLNEHHLPGSDPLMLWSNLHTDSALRLRPQRTGSGLRDA
ncbi:hypothetical protein ACI2LF_24010 [Kribbella sp. NPDC020789]|jgi:hypothetical protein